MAAHPGVSLFVVALVTNSGDLGRKSCPFLVHENDLPAAWLELWQSSSDLRLPSGTVGAVALTSLICRLGAITAGRLLAYLGSLSSVPGLQSH